MCYFLKKSKLSLPKFHNEQNIKVLHKDFPGGPVVGTSPSNAERAGSIPGQGNKIPHASWQNKIKQNIKQKQYCNKFNKVFKKCSTSKKCIQEFFTLL